MSKKVENLNKIISELIKEIDDELEEATVSGDATGYNTPNAFGDGSDKSKKKTKKVATQVGYTVVNEVSNPKLLKQLWTLGRDRTKYNPKYKDFLKKEFDGELSPHVDDFLRNSKSEKEFIKNVIKFEKDFKDNRGFKGGTTGKVDFSGKLKTEGKKPVKRTNRWLELKNDDTMHANKKLSVGLRELRNQLSEVEKFLGWYNKIKGINELDSDNYWKRTNTNIRKIKERIINIARTLQEIEK